MDEPTLLDLLREPYGHDQSDTFADQQINAMSNVELVDALGYALDRLIGFRVAQAVAAARADFPSSENP